MRLIFFFLLLLIAQKAIHNLIMRNDVVIEYHLNSLGTEEVDQHIAHVYCHEGKCDLYYNDSHVSFSEGDSMILINSKSVIRNFCEQNVRQQPLL